MLMDTLTRYRLGGNGGTSTGLVVSAARFTLEERLTLYWDYLNPSFLFFAGGSNPTMATARAGVFLLPIAVLLPLGAWMLARHRRAESLMLIVTFLVAPVPIVLTMPDAPEYSIGRAFLLVPAAVLIAAAGLQWMWRHRHRAVRIAAIILVMVLPVQFALFLGDYFTDYQTRSAPRFDPVAIRDLLPRVATLDHDVPAPAILFSDDLDDKSVRWRFYTLSTGRRDLWDKARYFIPDTFDPAEIEANSILVMYAHDPRIDRLMASGCCTKAAEVIGVSGEPAATILRRAGPADGSR
jgi:hypothetical protein